MTNLWTIVKENRLPLLLIVLLFACLLPNAALCDTSTRQVLIIHSYHPGFSWTDRINNGMTETLLASAPNVDIHIEYLDAKRYIPERIMPAFRELLFQKYQETPPEVIIVSDDVAFETILPLRDSFFPDVPLVFCGVNAFEKRMIDGFVDVTGVIEDFDLAGTLDLALSLQPGTKHLAVVSDSTATGRLNLERFRQIKSLYSDRFTSIIELAELSEEALRQELSRLEQKDTIILLLSFYRDRNGKAFSVPEMTELIAQSARLPVYSAWDFVLGHKVVGGRVVSGRQQGIVAAELAIRILNGEPAGTIPIVQVSPNVSLFDDRELSFFDIDRDKIPENSVILNRPVSSLQKYIWLIAGLVLFAIVETLLVLALLKKSRHYKIAEEELHRSKERFTLAMQAATDGIFDWNLETNDIYYSPAWKQMLGYREEELENRFSEWERLTAPEDVKHSWQMMKEHLEGKQERFEVEFKMRHKDGHWIDVLARASAVFDATGKAVRVVGTHVDITARKQAEKALRESEKRFRTLYMKTPAMMHSIDAQGRLIAVSKRWLEKMEYDTDEVLGRKSIDFLTEASRRYATEVTLPNFFQTGVANNTGYQMVSKSGRILDILMSAISEKDEQGKVIRSMAVLEDITERKQAEAALRKSEEKYRYMFENIQDAVYATALDGEILDISPSIKELSRGQLTREELIGKSVYDFYSDTETRKTFLETLQKSGRVNDYEITLKNRDGSMAVCSISAKMQYDSQGQPLKIIGNIHDISDRAALEKRLLQSQKMESIGRLAGGVAHDFNNMLGVILGYTEISLEQVSEIDPIHQSLLGIQQAAQRSADLTAQLLAFARKQAATPKVLELNRTVQGMLTMLRRLIGENIDLVWQPELSLAPVKIDPSQIDQILANLCVNARDAIAGTGTISIETANVTVAEIAAAENLETLPGHYVMLSISDSGCGMDSETLSHLFEPFFTTKRVGKGTGLGLATVYGIVKQNNGFIDVQSDVGSGTTFKIFLPRSDQENEQPTDSSDTTTMLSGAETVLLVEDETMILDLTTRMLEKLGYHVFALASPQAAIRFAEQHPEDIHLLLTDVIMPEMNGRDLANTILPHHPNLKCLFMSGYTADVIAHHGVLDEHLCFIQKPFTRSKLSQKIRDALRHGSC